MNKENTGRYISAQFKEELLGISFQKCKGLPQRAAKFLTLEAFNKELDKQMAGML